MITARNILRALPLLICAMLAIPPATPAQESVETEEAYRFTKEELTQMLAPIALYPDSLIAQILMASTYPVEIVEAERWMRDKKSLQGEALNEALKEMSWDPSVKSLCHFPDVLIAMSDKLDQTTKLGDAFLGQEDDVMNTIQDLRQKAEDQGNLKNTREQNVIVEQDIIRIEPANPEVVNVPVYDPLYVYGPWWYPSYPPYYWYYPYGMSISGGYIGFGPGIYLGFGLFSWSIFDWHHHSIHMDVNKIHRFDRHHFSRYADRPYWRHDPGHRRGVAYRERRTGDHFRGRDGRSLRVGGERRGNGEIRRPGDERRQPGGEVRRPGGEIRQPGGEVRRPGGEIRQPGGEVRRPGGEIRQPGGEIRRPGGEVRRPGGEIRQPGGGVSRPGGEIRQPGGEIRTPGGEVRRPGGEIRTPGGEVRRSGGEIIRGSGGVSPPRGSGGGGRESGGSYGRGGGQGI